MAKKFFYNKVYNTKKTIINVIIIASCIIGVIICFVVVSNFEGESYEKNVTYDLKAGVTIEVNENYSNEIFLSRIDNNIDLSKIKVKYPDNFDISKIGTYNLILNIDGDKENKDYNMPMTIVDTIKPELKVKELTIKVDEKYSPNDFVESCSDNSKHDCKIDFYDIGLDEEGNVIDYSNYNKEGEYSIKIVAKDDAENENIQETKLIIKKEDTGTTDPEPNDDPKPQECKYGNNEYDTDKYILTADITSNNCALSLDLYQEAVNLFEDTLSQQTFRKIIDTETIRIKKDVEALNLVGILRIEQHIGVILNKKGTGLVGYQLNLVITKENEGVIEEVTNYYLNHEGKRVFNNNPYNLPE